MRSSCSRGGRNRFRAMLSTSHDMSTCITHPLTNHRQGFRAAAARRSSRVLRPFLAGCAEAKIVTLDTVQVSILSRRWAKFIDGAPSRFSVDKSSAVSAAEAGSSIEGGTTRTISLESDIDTSDVDQALLMRTGLEAFIFTSTARSPSVQQQMRVSDAA